MARSDWDEAQRLIELGYCTLDQAREALAAQDRMRRDGLVPKPLHLILLEMGHVSREHLAGLGLAAPAAEAPPAGPPRSASRAPAVIFWALASAALLAAFVLALRGPAAGTAGPPPEATGADRAAADELERIAALQASSGDFGNAEEVIRRYRSFMERHAGRKWELEAHDRLRDYRARLEESARAELESIRAKETALRESGRLAELLGLYRGFPAKFLRVTDSGAEVADRIAEISRLMDEAFRRNKMEALRLLAEGRTGEAEARVRAMELNAEGDRLDEAAALRARIKIEERSVASRIRRDLADEYLRIDGRFREAMARKNPREAAAAIGEFLFRPRNDEEARLARVEGVDYGALRKALEEWRPAEIAAICDAAAADDERPGPAMAALLDLRGAAWVAILLDDAVRAHRAAVESGVELDLPGMGRGRFERRDGAVVFASAAGTAAPGELARLREDAVAGLAMRSGPRDGAAHARAGFFFYYAGKGLHLRAYEHLIAAMERGVRGVRPYVANLGALVEEERRRELEVKLEAAEDCLSRGQWIPARALLEEIQRSADHPFVRERAARIDRMQFDADRGLLAERRFAEAYRGKVESLEGGAMRVAYDFESAVQMEAFEVVTEEERLRLPGRWSIVEGALESSYRTAAVRWRAPVRGNVVIEYDLTALEEPQNIVLALYNRRGQAGHYAVVFGFDWVGRSEGDPDNSAEERFGMPRTCVLKYPVAVDKGRWMEAAQWDAWKSRIVGRELSQWRPVRGRTARVRVERLGGSIRVAADGGAIWEGEDGAYEEGRILFFSDCRCRIDDLRITTKPPAAETPK